MIRDTHSDHLEIIGDSLPTEAERAEMNAYFDALDERDHIAQMHADSKRGLAGANDAEGADVGNANWRAEGDGVDEAHLAVTVRSGVS